MQEKVTIHLEKAIRSVELMDDGSESVSTAGLGAAETIEVAAEQEGLMQVRGALEDAVRRVNEFEEQLVREHKGEIAKLSLEIARKVLAQKTAAGDYEIANIIEEALERAPTRSDLVLHLNPADAATYEKALGGASSEQESAFKIVADSSVGRAECVLETPKGIIESMIAGRLTRIGEALKKVE